MSSTMHAPRWATPGTVAARASIWCFVVYSLWQGAGIVIGGEIRWQGASFTYLKEVPGAPASWGWALILFGLILGMSSLVESWWWKLLALSGITTWSLGFSLGAQYATNTIETAPTTGGPVYLLVGFLAAILVLPDEARKAI